MNWWSSLGSLDKSKLVSEMGLEIELELIKVLEEITGKETVEVQFLLSLVDLLEKLRFL